MDPFAPERWRLPSQERPKALVVDGDDGSRAFAAEALNSFAPGFDVATARDPQQALAWLETFPPNLLVMDLGFASDGAGTLRERLRADARTRACRVVVVSSLSADDPRVESARLECDAVLIKPVGLPFLLETVRRVMSGDGSH
jgi:DNA-binding response OmpR family regulator